MTTSADAAVVIMAKQPVPGASKTRLVPALDERDAAELAEAFFLDALAMVRSIRAVTPQVAFAPATGRAYFEDVAPGIELVEQQGEGLAERLDGVLRAALERHEIVVAINADSPNLPAGRIVDAVARLADDQVDVVFGPTEDGGYYLIACRTPHDRLVTDVEMSTPTVLADSIGIADELGLGVALLDTWYDVDEPADLDRLMADIAAGVPCGAFTKAWLEVHR